MSNLPTLQSLQLDADLCVKCGVCLPHCPTYALRKEETESPRGRITLMQGLASGQLEQTREVQLRLSHCLSCGRCEQVCPANVPYTRLMDGSRMLFATTTDQHRSLRRLIARTLSSPAGLKILAMLAEAAKMLRLATLFPPATRAGRMLAWLPPRHKQTHQTDPAISPHTTTSDQANAEAMLFAGCISGAFERDVIRAAIVVGQHLGITLHLIDKGLCCGALYQHAGDHQSAQKLTQRIIDSCTASASMPVATLLSGCGKGLLDNLRFSTHDEAATLVDRINDIHALLAQAHSAAPFQSSNEKIAIYLPCTADSGHAKAMMELLNRVPGAELIVLGPGAGCCGASGDHMLIDAPAAAQLARPIVDELLHSGATRLLTNNLGCAWHLRAQLASVGAKIDVLHPLQWLAEQTLQPVSV